MLEFQFFLSFEWCLLKISFKEKQSENRVNTKWNDFDDKMNTEWEREKNWVNEWENVWNKINEYKK